MATKHVYARPAMTGSHSYHPACGAGRPPPVVEARTIQVIRDFKDTVYPFFESDTVFLECLFVLCLIRCFAILRIEGCLNSTL